LVPVATYGWLDGSSTLSGIGAATHAFMFSFGALLYVLSKPFDVYGWVAMLFWLRCSLPIVFVLFSPLLFGLLLHGAARWSRWVAVACAVDAWLGSLFALPAGSFVWASALSLLAISFWLVDEAGEPCQ